MHYVNLHYSISCKVSDIYLDAYRSLTVYIGYNHSSNNRQSYNRTSKCARQTAFIPVIRGSMDKFLHLQNKPKIHFNTPPPTYAEIYSCSSTGTIQQSL